MNSIEQAIEARKIDPTNLRAWLLYVAEADLSGEALKDAAQQALAGYPAAKWTPMPSVEGEGQT